MHTNFHIVPLKKWFTTNNSELIIAGPCSAENEKQILDTAKAISYIKKIQVFRAGIWKPRTSPYTFPGIGEKGLSWLAAIKKKYALKIITEVATPQHVSLCIQYGIDMVWIGARTTTNPFAVQELANALQGIDIPVWIKNPVISDINLWIGAFERIYMAGIQKLGGIFRGFFPTHQQKYRNYIDWKIIDQLKNKIPGLPILFDPSHIAGNKKFILEVINQGKNNPLDGWMIECHICPEKALSDKNQQVTPEILSSLI